MPLGDHVAPRLAEPAPLVDPSQAVMERLGGGLLQPQIDRGLNRQAVLVELLGAVPALELAAHFLEEIRCGRRRLSGGIGANHDRLLLQFVGLRCRDVADFRHAAEGVVAAAQRGLAIHIGALAHVGLQDAGDECRLLDRDVLRRLAEVQPRRRLDPVDAVPEVHLVAIEREDLALGVALLDLDREDRFLYFSLQVFYRRSGTACGSAAASECSPRACGAG